MRLQGLGVMHVREADNPGAFDLLVTSTYKVKSGGRTYPHRHVWIELKVMDEALRLSQREFARERTAAGELLLVARLRAAESVQLLDYLSLGEVLKIPQFRLQNWAVLLNRLLDEHYEFL